MKRSILAILVAGSVILPVSAQQQFPQQPYPQQQYPQQQYPQQQPPQQVDDSGYAPDHGVARISLVNGDVSVRRGDSGDLTAAALNGPLLVDDSLATGPGSRAEIQFDWGNMIRLGAGTEVRLGELEDRRYLVQIAAGTTTFRVLRDSNADVEISTPTVSVRPVEQGSYRVTVLPDGTTEITVRAGRAEILSPRGTEMLTAGRTMEARGTPSDPEYMILAAIPQDEWDRWNVDRDRVMERTSSYRYVSPDVVGAEELDPYGTWNNDPQYGNVWVPNVDPGWAPYRVGRWVDEPYYGWTWVSGDPWGWAPYHYGNWYQSSFGWAWYPGPLGGRHYWRPAMVGFFGWGSGGGIGFGFGNVGWVPLAPYERFRPWYGRGYNSTIIVNNVNYRNARFVNGRNGVTSVNANDFGRGRAINTNNFVRASNNDLARAGSVQGRLPFTASADARRMSDRQVSAQSVPRVVDNTRFAQRGGNGGGGGNRGALGQATQGPSQGFSQTRPAQPQSGGGFRGNNGPVNNTGNNNGNGGGWRTFNGVAPSDNRNGNGVQRSVQAPRAQPNPVAPQGNRGQVDRGQVDRGNNSNGPGWRTFNGGGSNAPAVIGGGGGRNIERAAPAPQMGNFPAPQQQQQQQQSQDQRQFRQSAPQQQPVRISPPIVRERAPSPAVSRPEPPRGGFGTPRPQGGGGGNGGGGGGNRGGGGESRGNNGGGHNNRR
jgi:FecR protein